MRNPKNRFPNLTRAQLDAIAPAMSYDIRDDIHIVLAPCSPGEFLTAYLDRDPSLADRLPMYALEAE